jgi:guanosine-3',5'-bis(diphosphate) 3'-pyrophosphohydrolase
MSINIEPARTFAIQKHAHQTYDGQPYEVHLQATYAVTERFSLPDSVKIAAWLHDTLEDTETSYTELKQNFGEEVAELVYCVTDELGRDRTERKLKTYPKILANPNSVLLKLADRIANVEASIQNNPRMLRKYQSEHAHFYENLYQPRPENAAIWAYYLQLIG